MNKSGVCCVIYGELEIKSSRCGVSTSGGRRRKNTRSLGILPQTEAGEAGTEMGKTGFGIFLVINCVVSGKVRSACVNIFERLHDYIVWNC